MGPDYRYVCEDRSILLPVYKRYVWQPALSFVSPDISPNSLSILGNFFSLCAFASLLLLTPEEHYLFLFPAACTFLYLCLDNMDGMHARRTAQSSPLGEFLDHWFDAFNSGYLVFGLYYAGRLPALAVLAILAGTNLAYFATMWEQRHTGVIRFGRGGQIEGVTVIVFVYLGIALFGHDLLCTTPLFGLLSVVELTAVLLCIGYATTIAGALWRTRQAFAEWIPLLLVNAGMVLWFHFGRIAFFPAAFLVLLTNSLFGGRHIIARVLGRPYAAAEPLLLIGMGLAVIASMVFDPARDVQTGVGWALVLYVLVRLGYDFVVTVDALRHHMRPGELLDRAFGGRKRPGRLS
jgi:phosphatidylglycerophosphate synthase